MPLMEQQQDTEAMLRAVQEAAAILRRGGLVALPTETVYGLGADAANPAAVARIFAAKGRPADHPVIVHLGNVSQLEQWATDIPDSAYTLAQAFWPGPLTLILKRHASVSDAVTGGQDTIGLRIPGHPIALALLNAFGGGIAAPSANRFGRICPTTAAHVREELGAAVDCILDGGPCQVGIESTIVDLSAEGARVLRPGGISAAALEAVLGYALSPVASITPRVPGALEVHYAPRTPLKLVAAEGLNATVMTHLQRGERVAVLARTGVSPDQRCRWESMPATATDYAQLLYAKLRALDDLTADIILIEAPPVEAAWQAVLDRLQRAAMRDDRFTAGC